MALSSTCLRISSANLSLRIRQCRARETTNYDAHFSGRAWRDIAQLDDDALDELVSKIRGALPEAWAEELAAQDSLLLKWLPGSKAGLQIADEDWNDRLRDVLRSEFAPRGRRNLQALIANRPETAEAYRRLQGHIHAIAQSIWQSNWNKRDQLTEPPSQGGRTSAVPRAGAARLRAPASFAAAGSRVRRGAAGQTQTARFRRRPASVRSRQA